MAATLTLMFWANVGGMDGRNRSKRFNRLCSIFSRKLAVLLSRNTNNINDKGGNGGRRDRGSWMVEEWFSFLNKAQCFLEFGELIGIGGSLNWGIWGF